MGYVEVCCGVLSALAFASWGLTFIVVVGIHMQDEHWRVELLQAMHDGSLPEWAEIDPYILRLKAGAW